MHHLGLVVDEGQVMGLGGQIAALLLLAGNLAAQTDWEWEATAPLSEGRSEACVVRLADGRVLVAGGRERPLPRLRR